MAKRSIDFKNIRNFRDSKGFQTFRNIRQHVPVHRDMLDREALRQGIAQRRDALKRTVEDKREALKRNPHTGPGHSLALTRTHKAAIAGVATLGAAAMAVSLVPDHSGAQSADHSSKAAYSVSEGQQAKKDLHSSVTSQGAAADQKAKEAKAAKAAAAKKDTASSTSASSAVSAAQADAPQKTKKPTYPNNLDGWIRESLAILKAHDIPASYDGIHRNIMRESSGNPMAINLWDINAQNGVPSKGLLQVIPPTFATYHVSGTSWNIYDPVANITAACNYAADRYGSMDNVNSAY